MTSDTIWQWLPAAVFLVGLFGWLASVVWQTYHDYNSPNEPFAIKDKPPPWTRVQRWIVGLGSAFVLLIVLSRISGSKDTDFLTGWVWTIGTIAVFGWSVTALLAFGIFVWRLSLFIRARLRGARRS